MSEVRTYGLAMPSGIIHEQLRKKGRVVFYPFSIIIPIFLSPVNFKTGGEVLIGIGIIAGYELGKYVTCDWDIMGVTSDEGRIVNDLPVFGHFIFGVSSFYGSVFRGHHRSFITHFPFISTSIRYILLFWYPFIYIYQSERDLSFLAFIFIGMFIGLSFSDGIHWWADVKTKWQRED